MNIELGKGRALRDAAAAGAGCVPAVTTDLTKLLHVKPFGTIGAKNLTRPHTSAASGEGDFAKIWYFRRMAGAQPGDAKF
jgi:hypothetical protein